MENPNKKEKLEIEHKQQGVESFKENEKQEDALTSVPVQDVKQEITQKQHSINDTFEKINKIRNQLGLGETTEIPPSIESTQDVVDSLKEKDSNLENFKFTIIEPLKEETPEEFISRSMKHIVDEYINNDSVIRDTHPIIKKAYYGKYTNESMEKVFSEKENCSNIKNILSQLEVNNDKKFSEIKNNETFENLTKRAWGSSRDSASGDVNKKVDYYNNTNQIRDFLSHGRKRDAFSYASMMFGLPENFINTEEGKEYLRHQVDNKNIFLFGGGDSIKDLLKSTEFKPKKVINFDPFIKKETIDKNPNGIYESLMISASDKKIVEMLNKNEIPKADEVWATYSVPYYLDSSEDIKELITNMLSVLNEGGNARISPISVQSKEEGGENFETRKQAFINSIKELLDSQDYNVTIFNDTIKIHKIKK
jgi:hypothetical protein